MCVFRPGNSSVPIWITHMTSGSTDTCVLDRNYCRSSSVSNCVHSEDVTVTCSKTFIYLVIKKLHLCISGYISIATVYNTNSSCVGMFCHIFTIPLFL